MHIVIATTQVPFVHGGAEVHAENLRNALEVAGHQAAVIAIPYKWYPPERIVETMLACRLLDLEEANGQTIDLLIGLKFPAYLIRHPNKVLWILHQHRTAYEQWDHALGDMINFPNGREVRAAIHAADTKLIPEAKRVFSNSRNVTARLKKFCGVASTPLYHPPAHADRFYSEEAGDYLFFPSRINQSKRQLLAIQAMALTRSKIKLVICGQSEDATYFQAMTQFIEKHNLTDRVKLVGRVTEERKLALYAKAFGVLYLPYDEDYGYVTIEAMLAAKPVITCTDSGGPLEFLDEGETGYAAAPDAAALAGAIDRLAANREAAAQMGREGAARYRAMDISWDSVVATLTE